MLDFLLLLYLRILIASALSARKKSCFLSAPTTFLRYTPTLKTVEKYIQMTQTGKSWVAEEDRGGVLVGARAAPVLSLGGGGYAGAKYA